METIPDIRLLVSFPFPSLGWKQIVFTWKKIRIISDICLPVFLPFPFLIARLTSFSTV